MAHSTFDCVWWTHCNRCKLESFTTLNDAYICRCPSLTSILYKFITTIRFGQPSYLFRFSHGFCRLSHSVYVSNLKSNYKWHIRCLRVKKKMIYYIILFWSDKRSSHIGTAADDDDVCAHVNIWHIWACTTISMELRSGVVVNNSCQYYFI